MEVVEEQYEGEEEELHEWEGVESYINLQNEFIPQLTRETAEICGEYKIIPFNVPGMILESTADYYKEGDVLTPQQMQTLEIRRALIGGENSFEFAKLIAGRQSLLFTAESYQKRVEFREQFAMAAASFLLQHFSCKERLNQKVIQKLTVNEDLERSSLLTYAEPGVLVITASSYQAWRCCESILECIPSLLEKNVMNRRKLDKYAPSQSSEVFNVEGQKLLADEIPDELFCKINLERPEEYYIQNINSSSSFLFGFSFFRRTHKLEMMSRIRKSDCLFGSVDGILKYGAKEGDFSFLSGIHTVYIEDFDKICYSDIVKLKTVLAYIGRRPKMIEHVNVCFLTQNCKKAKAVNSVEYVCSQKAENEYANKLFDAQLRNSNFDAERTEIEEIEEKEIYIEGNCAHNEFGLLKLNVLIQESVFNDLGCKFIIQKIQEEQYISVRKTDDLPENTIKFDLSEYPKLDYLVNKEMNNEEKTIIVLPTMIYYERLLHILTKLKIKVSLLPLNSEEEDARKHIKRLKKDVHNILITTEDEMLRKFHILPLVDKIIFFSPPRDFDLFVFMVKNKCSCGRIYWDESELTRWSNLISQEEMLKIMKNNVVLM